MKRYLRVLMVGMALLACSGLVQAREMYSLLVGVSEYPSLEKRYYLEGPRNDIQRMREILKLRGFAPEGMTVLADGVPAADGLPTRAAILDAFDALAKKAKRGDYVMLYFAGHGSQQPADRSSPEGRNEADGLFETFLPRDVGPWQDEAKTVQNALVSHEIRRAVDRIMAKGAFVWGIFDSCHSATLVRGADDNQEVRYRYVAPQMLNIPDKVLDAAAANRPRTRGGPDSTPANPFESTGAKGGVFFYAAQTTEQAPEMRLPAGHPDRKPYGLFGFTIMQALESGNPMTYRQMAQYVLSQYGGMNQTRVTPLFSGDKLDTAVLGQDVLPVRQWRIERSPGLAVASGALAQVTEGSLFAMVANPLDKTEGAIGYAKATTVGMASATLVPVAHEGRPALDAKDIPASAYARMVQQAGQYTLNVSIDASECGAACAATPAIAALQNKGVPGTQINWRKAGEVGDVAVRVTPRRIQLLPPSLQGIRCSARKTPADRKSCEDDIRDGALTLPWTPDEAPAALQTVLSEALHSVSRAANLMRISSQINQRALASQLKVEARKISKGGKPSTIAPERNAVLRAGDAVEIELANTGDAALDVTVLYIDANYGISVLYPTSGASNRLERKASHKFNIDVNDETTGLERLVIIGVQMKALGERADFSFLAQSAVTQMDERNRDVNMSGGTRSASDGSSALDAFRDAGFAENTSRGATAAGVPAGGRTSMQVFNWVIQK